MYQEKRPTCVTVIGWAWILLGGLMCISSLLALFVYFTAMGDMTQSAFEKTEGAIVFKYFPVLCVFQTIIGAFGAYAGINFLKFKPWARTVLEVFTWLILVFFVGFGVFQIWFMASNIPSKAPNNFAVISAVMTILIFAVYVVPFGFMLRSLRGPTVANAMINKDTNASAC